MKLLYRFKIRHFEAMKRQNLLTFFIFQSMKRLYRIKIRHFSDQATQFPNLQYISIDEAILSLSKPLLMR
jgi:hypothetical protein